MRKRLVVVLLIVLCGAVLFLIAKEQTKSKNSTFERGSQTTAPVPTREEYRVFKENFLNVVQEADPGVALASLREQIKDNDPLSRVCHDITHEIGHEAYEKYGSFGEAMQFQDEICNSGYLHGVIERHFLSADDLTSTMQTTCAAYNPGSFMHWECIHGIGHGLMFFTNNDVPKSLELCDTYPSQFERSTCVNGVFMENFIVDQETHTSKYVSDDNWLFPCSDQEKKHKTDCYIYAPTYYLSQNENDYIGALNLCRNAEDAFVDTCIQGVGSQAMKEHINDPKFVEAQCMTGTEKTGECLEGVVGLYINHFGGLSEAKQLCTILEPDNRKTCEHVINSREILF